PWRAPQRFALKWLTQQYLHDLLHRAPVIQDLAPRPAGSQVLREAIAMHPKQLLQSLHVGTGIDGDRRPPSKTRHHFDFTETATEDVIKTRRFIWLADCARQRRLSPLSFSLAAEFVFDQ